MLGAHALEICMFFECAKTELEFFFFFDVFYIIRELNSDWMIRGNAMLEN